jgi:hypothetical protein
LDDNSKGLTCWRCALAVADNENKKTNPMSAMDFQELISRFGLALGIGLLFGLKCGWRMRGEPPGGRTAGIRTFAISGILGGAVGTTAQTLDGVGSGIVLGLGFAAFSAGLAMFCLEENRAQKDFSGTTWVAATLTFTLGAYALVGDMRAAAGLAVAASLILALREPLHGWVEKLTWPELWSALVLLAMTFIALPIVPNAPIGPLGGVNPREVWLIAIVLAGASFVGYVAVKYFGAATAFCLRAPRGDWRHRPLSRSPMRGARHCKKVHRVSSQPPALASAAA